MNILLRLRTVHPRLKMRLTEDAIDDAIDDLEMADHDSPAWPVLTRSLFKAMDSRDEIRRWLDAAGVPPEQRAMGTVEFLTWGLLSVLAMRAVAGAAGWIGA